MIAAPTQDAYDAACRALAHWRAEAKRLGKIAGVKPRRDGWSMGDHFWFSQKCVFGGTPSSEQRARAGVGRIPRMARLNVGSAEADEANRLVNNIVRVCTQASK